MISDKCTSHTSDIIRELYTEKGIKHISIPSNCTKYIQPLDVSIFRSFKAKLDQLKSEYIESNLNERTKAGNIKNPTRQNAINWISIAFEDISSEIIEIKKNQSHLIIVLNLRVNLIFKS
ncbi:unnamed protein product [Blepharisma stoltei]|uniref:DDE-1 domain-containing protein n=1 Tax=Blepharisma stoltei TaxID=1481888 RepID=A0AAU9KB84_9CILI|nr:unnamed protein product [Blepharisma stoltei]